jgi:hypothetical protein
MPTAPFRSFQRTPLLFLSMNTQGHLPLLATDDVHAVLRDLWLQLARQSGWFVGEYLILPSEVGFLVAPSARPWPLPVWLAGWRNLSKARIAACSQWRGEVWRHDFSITFLVSIEDYRARLARLDEAASREGAEKALAPWRHRGILWELLPETGGVMPARLNGHVASRGPARRPAHRRAG